MTKQQQASALHLFTLIPHTPTWQGRDDIYTHSRLC